jgi:hypothetical protein
MQFSAREVLHSEKIRDKLKLSISRQFRKVCYIIVD